jgi:predicted nicotinamide N-methyase
VSSWSEVESRYDLTETVVDLSADISITIAHIRDLNALVDGLNEDDFGPDERLPYWATLWPSAIGLGRFLFSKTRQLEAPAIELGAGLALPSIVLRRAGLEVLATDYEPDALAFARHNAELNGVHIDTLQLDWRETGKKALGRFRTVIASDVLYEARNVEPLAKSLSTLLDPTGTAVVADPGRPHLTEFKAAIERRGLILEQIEREGVLFLLARSRAL